MITLAASSMTAQPKQRRVQNTETQQQQKKKQPSSAMSLRAQISFPTAVDVPEEERLDCRSGHDRLSGPGWGGKANGRPAVVLVVDSPHHVNALQELVDSVFLELLQLNLHLYQRPFRCDLERAQIGFVKLHNIATLEGLVDALIAALVISDDVYRLNLWPCIQLHNEVLGECVVEEDGIGFGELVRTVATSCNNRPPAACTHPEQRGDLLVSAI